MNLNTTALSAAQPLKSDAHRLDMQEQESQDSWCSQIKISITFYYSNLLECSELLFQAKPLSLPGQGEFAGQQL